MPYLMTSPRRRDPQFANGTGISSPAALANDYPMLSDTTTYSGSSRPVGGSPGMAGPAPMGPTQPDFQTQLRYQNMGLIGRGPSPNSTAGMMQRAYNDPSFAYAMADRQNRDAQAATARANAARSAPMPTMYNGPGTASATLPGGQTIQRDFAPRFNNPLPALAARENYAQREEGMAGDAQARADYLSVPFSGSPSFSSDRMNAQTFAQKLPGMLDAQTEATRQAPQMAQDAAIIKQLPAFMNAQTNAARAQQQKDYQDEDLKIKRASTQTSADLRKQQQDRLDKTAAQSGKDTPAARKMAILKHAMEAANDSAGPYFNDLEGAIRATHHGMSLIDQLEGGGTTADGQLPPGVAAPPKTSPTTQPSAQATTQPGGADFSKYIPSNWKQDQDGTYIDPSGTRYKVSIENGKVVADPV